MWLFVKDNTVYVKAQNTVYEVQEENRSTIQFNQQQVSPLNLCSIFFSKILIFANKPESGFNWSQKAFLVCSGYTRDEHVAFFVGALVLIVFCLFFKVTECTLYTMFLLIDTLHYTYLKSSKDYPKHTKTPKNRKIPKSRSKKIFQHIKDTKLNAFNFHFPRISGKRRKFVKLHIWIQKISTRQISKYFFCDTSNSSMKKCWTFDPNFFPYFHTFQCRNVWNFSRYPLHTTHTRTFSLTPVFDWYSHVVNTKSTHKIFSALPEKFSWHLR